MTNEIYKLFRQTLPDILRNEDAVKKILSNENNHIITVKEENRLIGVSVIRENVIYLLCVDDNAQNSGIGTQLLRQSEEYISSKGFDKVIVGAGKEYIMPGVPMNRGAHNFFIKHGYTHSWGDEGCYDMAQYLANYECDISIGDTINGITYRWAAEADRDNVIKCVNDSYNQFTDYYQDPAFYQSNGKTSVLMAEQNNEIVGVLQVAKNVEADGVGSVGCTVTSEKHQGKGIATTLVKLGTKHLKESGLEKGFLGYTYTAIVHMYGRSGYEISMEYFMGQKIL